jgi:hypothetical protein
LFDKFIINEILTESEKEKHGLTLGIVADQKFEDSKNPGLKINQKSLLLVVK